MRFATFCNQIACDLWHFEGKCRQSRFGLSWDGGGISSNRLSDWLDPSGTNTGTLNSFPELNLETFEYDLEL